MLAITTIFSPTLTGQTQTEAPKNSIPSPPFGSTRDVIAPSPSAGSIGIFGQIPVGCYTGTADISIPLYNIQYKDLSVPISIAYHASGNKPDIFPGPVGLCWAIQAGGNITRTINGNPDTGGLPFDNEIIPVRPGDKNERAQEKWWDVTSHYGDVIQTAGIVFSGEDDPDEYNYNINGETGRFYINHKDTFEVQSDQGSFYKVTMNIRNKREYTFPEVERIKFPTPPLTDTQKQYLNSFFGYYSSCYSDDYKYNPTISIFNVINGFTMIDVNGVKYTFGNADNNYDNDNAIEFSRLGFNDYTIETDFSIQPMSWQLTSIESPNGYKIQFVYDRNLYITRIRFSDLALYQYANDPTQKRPPSSLYEDAYRSTLINGSVLKEIVLPNGKVIFFSSKATEQLDYPQNNDVNAYYNSNNFNQFYYYSDIAFANTEKIVFPFDNNPETVRNRFFPSKIDSIRIYNSDNNTVQKIGFQYTNNRNTRLKLQSVDITGNQANPQRYQFKYNPLSLPPYLSNQTDYYGFYNGKTLFAASDWSKYNNITTLMRNNPDYIDQKKAPDFNYAKAEILDTIIYPTKGYTVFEYEPHDYQAKYNNWVYGLETLSDKNIDAGGVRIKSVKNYNNNNVLLNSKNYIYTMQRNGATVSSGILAYKPVFVQQHNDVTLAYTRITGSWQTNNNSYYTTDAQGYWGNTDIRTVSLRSFLRFSTNPVYPMGESRGNHITYSEVKIVEEGNGYQINKYKNFDNGYADRPLFGYLTNNVRDDVGQNIAYWKQEDGNSMKAERGQLLSQEFYKEDGTKVRQINNTYNDNENRFEEGVRFIRKTENDVSLTGEHSCCITSGFIYTYFPYLRQKKTTDYTLNDSVVQTIDYTYDDKYRLQKSVTVKDSENNNYDTETFYPFDKTEESEIYKQMTDSGMLAFPVEQTLHKGGNLIKTDKLTYTNDLVTGKPEMILPYQTFTQYANNTLSLEKTILKYDAVGNPLCIVYKTDTVTYLWGYNSQYPIAEIKNATYEQVKSALGYSDAQIESVSAQSNPDVAGIDTKLRAYFKDNIYQVATYTYKPLVGMLTMTDPQGATTYYDYDAFGRLKETYYYENNDKGKKRKVEMYDYHYKD